MKWHYAMATVFLTMTASPVMSGEIDHAGCNSDVTVHVDKMGIVNEDTLQEHIDAAQHSLDQIHLKGTRSRERKRLLRGHLAKMQQAMEEMHNLKLTGDCAAAAHGASPETRISVLEKRMDMIQDMLRQLVANQNEGSRE